MPGGFADFNFKWNLLAFQSITWCTVQPPVQGYMRNNKNFIQLVPVVGQQGIDRLINPQSNTGLKGTPDKFFLTIVFQNPGNLLPDCHQGIPTCTELPISPLGPCFRPIGNLYRGAGLFIK